MFITPKRNSLHSIVVLCDRLRLLSPGVPGAFRKFALRHLAFMEDVPSYLCLLTKRSRRGFSPLWEKGKSETSVLHLFCCKLLGRQCECPATIGAPPRNHRACHCHAAELESVCEHLHFVSIHVLCRLARSVQR